MFLTAEVNEDVLRRELSTAWERGGVLETGGGMGRNSASLLPKSCQCCLALEAETYGFTLISSFVLPKHKCSARGNINHLGLFSHYW